MERESDNVQGRAAGLVVDHWATSPTGRAPTRLLRASYLSSVFVHSSAFSVSSNQYSSRRGATSVRINRAIPLYVVAFTVCFWAEETMADLIAPSEILCVRRYRLVQSCEAVADNIDDARVDTAFS